MQVIANSREKQLKNIARALRINKVYYNEHLYLMLAGVYPELDVECKRQAQE